MHMSFTALVHIVDIPDELELSDELPERAVFNRRDRHRRRSGNDFLRRHIRLALNGSELALELLVARLDRLGDFLGVLQAALRGTLDAGSLGRALALLSNVLLLRTQCHEHTVHGHDSNARTRT